MALQPVDCVSFIPRTGLPGLVSTTESTLGEIAVDIASPYGPTREENCLGTTFGMTRGERGKSSAVFRYV
jgi:hypothetical protein